MLVRQGFYVDRHIPYQPKELQKNPAGAPLFVAFGPSRY